MIESKKADRPEEFFHIFPISYFDTYLYLLTEFKYYLNKYQ